jgi:hypothetical protein
MLVYVAANPGRGFCDRDAVVEVMSQVRAAGHTITHDWLLERATEDGPDGRQRAAIMDLEGVRQCDVLLLVYSETGKGIFTEFGAALAWNKHIIVVDATYDMIFFSHPNVRKAATVAEALKTLEAEA